MRLNRRDMLLATGAAMVGMRPLGRSRAADQVAPKKVLFFTKSSVFQHPVVARKGDELSLAERILTRVGEENGFEVVASKDGRLFDPDKIGQWDAFAFQTQGDLTLPGIDLAPPMSREGKQAFLDAIRDGKGFLGMHCATDTFHGKPDTLDPYIEMIGGEFIIHGDQQVAKLDVVDPGFPGANAFGQSPKINDEWYALRNFADNLHVIIAHDTAEMKGVMYKRPAFPQTWARMHGKGKVFYTSMGHREDVWENPLYQGLLIGALGWVTGKVEASVEPNWAKFTPDCKKLGE